jgi:hypothetical protein
MQLLIWLPAALFEAVFLITLLGLLVTLVIKTPYNLSAQSILLVLVLGSAYMTGAKHVDNHRQQQVRVLEQKLAEAKDQAVAANAKISTRVVTQTKVVKQNVYVNKEILREVVSPQLDNVCTLPTSSIVLHNSASANTVATGPTSIDGTPSGVAASRLLQTVVENYGSCHENALKLRAWQDWYRTQSEIFNRVHQ